MSLRTRLVLGLVALAALALLAADVATYASLRSFLLDRTDSTLQNDHVGVEHALEGTGPSADSCAMARGSVPPDVYFELRTIAGRVVCSQDAVDFSNRPPAQSAGSPALEPARLPPPQLPASLGLGGTTGGSPDRARYFDAPATRGGKNYRVRASFEPSLSAQLVVARTLDDVESTLHRLLLIEALVTTGVLVAIALLGLWAIRLGLRPLDAIGDTAAKIAAGDLSRRVERADDRTEIGRLGLALNAMLGQIESAFEGRSASERRLRRFVADASHELRTPLTAVRGYAELFRRGAHRRPEDLARAMSGIERESERMSRLVDDLLLLARLDEGRPLERDEVELDRVVTDAVETAAAVEPGRPIRLRAEPALVVGDADRLRQIVDNLLGNVRAHTPPETAVDVRVRRVNGSAVVEVADSGPGLSAEEAEHVFERFYRADASRSRSAGGAGLGLSIVAAVAEAHGGRVAAQSRPGAGTTFTITLPLVGATPAAPDGPTAPRRESD